MINALRNEFHTDMALSISNEIQYKRSNYYYFLGKVDPWASNDQSPVTIQADSDYENSLIRSNLMFMRKITPNDVSIVTTRHNWTSGTVYSSYDHTVDMRQLSFYCVTNDYQVYKCLDNNGGVASTDKPTSKSFYTFRTTDGYLWKYMYTIPSFKRSRFMSLDKIPVQRALSDSFYNKGSVDAVSIENGGNGYVDVLLTTIVISGSTTGSGAVGTITCGPTGNITSVTISNGGTGYTKGVTVAFNTISGYGATATANITTGVITGLTITNAGVGYVTGQTISFTVGGAVIVPSVSRTTGSIESVTILKSGSGYTVNPTLTVNTASTGSGKYGNSTAILSSVAFNGSIVNVNITDPGINYPADNNTNIIVQGDGTDAEFSPVIYNGEIIDVVVENPGEGYTTISLTVSGTGTLANIVPIISTSDFQSDQSIVEQTTVVGAVYSIPVTAGGNNYSQATTSVTITGDGVGCTATATVVGGSITKITVNNYGSGYTYANVAIVDSIRSNLSNYIDASAYAVLSPYNGHGYDAVTELFGDTVAINTSLRQDSNLNKLLQDYRQFGLIKNPKNVLTGKNITETSSLLLYETVFSSIVGLVLDEVLIQNSNKFRVVYVSGNVVYLQQLGVKYTNIVGTIAAETNSSRTYTINNVTKYPTANKYSGNLLYVSNENPFTFSPEQGIVIKTFLKF